MDVSVIIVNWNTRDLLLDCVTSLYTTTKDLKFEIFLVDNASSDDSVASVRERYPEVQIIQNNRNLGFAAANNKALRGMRGRYALLLNTDTVLTDDAISRLVAFMDRHADAGMACGQLLNGDGSKQNSVANFPTFLPMLCNETILRILLPGKFPSKRREYTEPVEVDSCIGACLMVRKKAIDEVGLLDERYFFFMEETDWALTMRKAGWKSYLVPDACIYHLQGQSAGHNVRSRIMFYRSRYTYFKKWFPLSWPFFVLVLFVRLVINILLNFIGVVATLGINVGIRGRLALYLQLFLWHLKGCP